MTGEPNPSQSLEEIIGNSAAEEEAAGDVISQKDLRAMADTLDLIVADFGSWKEYKATSTEYIKEFKNEIIWHRRIRFCVAIASAFMVLFLVVGLVLSLLFARSLFGDGQSHSLTALIVGCITGSVVITIASVKGAYSNLADRNAELPMPEHFKEVIDALQGTVGGN